MIVVGVLVIAGAATYRFVRSVGADARYVVGACLDAIPLEDGPMDSDPVVVDCAADTAKSRIIAIHENTPAAAAREGCPREWVAAIERRGRLLCLVDA